MDRSVSIGGFDRQSRRVARWFYRLLRHPRRLKGSRFRQWLGGLVLDKRLWALERRTFCLGAAAGCGLSMLPFFVPQMFLAAVICAWRRWNIPVAMAGCWISNVATVVPQIYGQVMLGEWVLARGGGGGGLKLDQLEQAVRESVAGGLLNQVTVRAARLAEALEGHFDGWVVGVVLTVPLFALAGWVAAWGFVMTFPHVVPVAHAVPHRAGRAEEGR